MQTDDIDGYILTGGNSSRMGRPKGRLTLGGVSFVERIAAALSEQCRTIYTVGDDETYTPLENVPDSHMAAERRSSIAGLFSALSHGGTEWVLVVACDLPFVTAGLFGRLAEMRSAEFGAVVPVDRNGLPQPLCGLYRVSACVDEFADSITRGQLKIARTLPRVNALLLPFETFSGLAGVENFFRNINTPEDLAAAEALA